MVATAQNVAGATVFIALESATVQAHASTSNQTRAGIILQDAVSFARAVTVVEARVSVTTANATLSSYISGTTPFADRFLLHNPHKRHRVLASEGRRRLGVVKPGSTRVRALPL